MVVCVCRSEEWISIERFVRLAWTMKKVIQVRSMSGEQSKLSFSRQGIWCGRGRERERE